MQQQSIGSILQSSAGIAPGTTAKLLPRLLEALRTHLGLDVGFISRFTEGRREFVYVTNDAVGTVPEVGASDPLEESTCFRVATGRTPNLVTDAGEHPSLSDLEVIGRLDIKTHISVPIPLDEGNVFGTLCCYSTGSTRELDNRDVGFMSALADIIGSALQEEQNARERVERRKARIRSVLESGNLKMVWQPIVDADTRQVLAVESLARFHTDPYRPPNEWFDEAVDLGIGAELERIAFSKAIDILPQLPEGVQVTCNVSGETLLDREFQAFLDQLKLDDIVIEITEHDVISDYASVGEVLERLRERGAQLAIDDFGAGYASFRHILELNPELIKLDMSMVRDINLNARTQTVISALMQYAQDDATRIVAEGVETEDELAVLRKLGIRRIQGYLMHKPLDQDGLVRLAGRALH